jgi:hypothetical protein
MDADDNTTSQMFQTSGSQTFLGFYKLIRNSPALPYIKHSSEQGFALSTVTDKWQTRPLVREGAPYGQDCNFQSK